MRIRVAQCLCGPRRHAVLGMAITTSIDELSDKDALIGLRQVVGEIVAGRGAELKMNVPSYIDPWCRICGAKAATWWYEIRWSKDYESEEAAIADIHHLETEQKVSATIMELLDLTYNASLIRPKK